MRLNKFLSETGAWSRRGADAVIEAGRVTINGQRAGLGSQVGDGDDVRVDGAAVGPSRKQVAPVYIALNKPAGVTCTTERHVAGNVVDFVGHRERIFPIGRLDKDSEGLLLLTNDGDVVNEVLRVEHGHEKEYVVAIDAPVTPTFLADLARGVRLDDGEVTRPCRAWAVGPRVFRIVLTQGLNRQIRRMCSAFGHRVVTLQRVRIMHIALGSLPTGRWRDLTAAEIDGLWRRGPAPPPATARPAAPRPAGHGRTTPRGPRPPSQGQSRRRPSRG
ncbi:MAG: pseudouridine synthase [Kofleriaceae bacterium]